MGDYEELLKKIQEKIETSARQQTDDIKRELQTEISKVRVDFDIVTSNIATNKKEIQIVKENQKAFEYTINKALKKNNLIIFGLTYEKVEGGEDLVTFTTKKLHSLLNIFVEKHHIDIFQIGKDPNPNKPILVKFVSFLTKVEVLKACKVLKGTSISIAEDLTQEERKKIKVLVKHKKAAIAKGQKAFIRNLKLFVNDEEYNVEDLEEEQGDSESEEEEEEEIALPKSNSAPPTPTVIAVNTETENFCEKNSELLQQPLKEVKVGAPPCSKRSAPTNKGRKATEVKQTLEANVKERLRKHSATTEKQSLGTPPSSRK